MMNHQSAELVLRGFPAHIRTGGDGYLTGVAMLTFSIVIVITLQHVQANSYRYEDSMSLGDDINFSWDLDYSLPPDFSVDFSWDLDYSMLPPPPPPSDDYSIEYSDDFSISDIVPPSLFPSDSNAPTCDPSDVPLLSPSSFPSYSPSTIPSSSPTTFTHFPTSRPPRFPPTLRPSPLPTLFPTFQPSAPTLGPTSRPTPPPKAPTLKPTSGPTGVPTSTPTATTIMEIQLSQELSGIRADDFNSDPNVGISFTQSVAVAMGISNNSVHVTGVYEIESIESSTTLRRILNIYFATTSSIVRKLANLKLKIDYSVILVMQSLGYQDPDEAVTQLKQSIEESVNTGEFTEILKTMSKSFAVKILQNVTATTIAVKKVVLTYNSAPPTVVPTSQPTIKIHKRSSNFSPKGLIGVIIAVVFTCVLGFLYLVLRYRYFLHKVIPALPNGFVNVNP